MHTRFLPLSHRALAVALVAAATGAHADPGDQQVDDIFVTATRTARTQDDTLAAVSVITREDIERLQARSLPDVLRGMPGVTLTNNGGPGKTTFAFLRGAESDQVLVLVDGIKIGSATSGTTALQDIPIEQIERIEIVRGPHSSLYGSEAIGGVIQIFTRRPAGRAAPYASAGFGSFGSRRGNVGIGGQVGDAWYSFNAAAERTDGIDACRGSGTLFAGCFTDEPDRDGYRNHSIVLQGGYRFDEHWDAEARLLRGDGESEYDGGFSNFADTRQQVAGTRVRYAPSKALTLTLDAGRSRDESDDDHDGEFASRFETQRDVASLQADWNATAASLVTLGLDYQGDHVDSSTEFDKANRTSRGAFVQLQTRHGANDWQASVRHDDNSQFGGKSTGSVLWGYAFEPTLRLTASVGTAFKMPSFNDLYYPGFGNPTLDPETSRSGELGLRGTPSWGKWTLAAFQTNVDDLIAFDPVTFAPVNVDRARIRGLEATFDTELAGWQWHNSLTWLDPRNTSDSADRGNQLPRRPRHSARIDLDRAFGAFSAGASVNAAGSRYDEIANRTRLGGYSTLDVRVAWRFASEWTLQLSGENLLDHRYETANWFNQPGRAGYATIRYQAAP